MKRIIPSLLLLSVAACSVGPHDLDAHASMPPAPAAQTFAPRAGPAQATVDTSAPGNWWHAFGSDKLDALVDEALRHATDIDIADAALRQAQQQAAAAGGALLPQIDANYQAERTRVSKALSPAVTDQNQYLYTLHTAQLTVSYAPDIFGANRSRIRSARAAAEVQSHRLDAARTTVVANLIQALIQRASLADQVTAAETAVTVNRDILKNLVRRQQLGEVGAADIATQQTALASAEAAVPALVRSEEHQRVLIATLIGRPAGSDLPALPSMSELVLPHDLPLVVPSDLVSRRPDVQAARAQLEGAGADVGTAIAARLPSIQLSANVGGAAQQFTHMFSDGNPFWALLGGITQPLFHGKSLLHQQHAAEAALDGAKAQYRAAVLQAFGDVSDALTGLRTDADALDAAARAADASGRALTFVRRQLQLGDVGTLNLLNATAADAQARSQLIQARAARFNDTVALFQAAGGVISEK